MFKRFDVRRGNEKLESWTEIPPCRRKVRRHVTIRRVDIYRCDFCSWVFSFLCKYDAPRIILRDDKKNGICRFLFLIPRSWFFSVYRYQGTIEGDGQGYKVRKGRRSERVWKIVRGNMQQPVLEFRTLPSDCKSSRIKLSGRRSKIKLTNKFQPCNWEITRDCRCRHGTVRNEKTKACIPFSKCPNVL